MSISSEKWVVLCALKVMLLVRYKIGHMAEIVGDMLYNPESQTIRILHPRDIFDRI
jgi:hypothetical protein